MTGLKDLFASERGVFAIFVTLICTAMLIMGRMTVEQWMDYTKWIAIALILCKTVTTAITTVKNGSGEPATSAKLGTLAENQPPS